MSYSYLKNVFPKFEDSTKVYNSSLYTNISTCESSIPVPKNINENINENINQIKNNKHQDNIDLPQKTLLESFNPETFITNKKSSDNLKFYNLPYVSHKNTIEKFEDTTITKLDCDLYIKHINECNKCKSICLKQFGIETDRIKNEEIMEIISYIVFGLFILLLIDYLKTSK